MRAFQDIATEIEKQLERERDDVELMTVMQGAWHCRIKYPGLFFEEGNSGHSEEKILIQLETELWLSGCKNLYIKPNVLKQRIPEKCGQLIMEEFADDVRPFLFEHSGVKKIERFADGIRKYPMNETLL